MDVKEACDQADDVSEIEYVQMHRSQKTKIKQEQDGDKSTNSSSEPDDQVQLLSQLDKFVKGCFGDNEYVQVQCCSSICKLLGREKDPPIDQAVKTDVVPRLVEFLTNEKNPKLQYEAAWVLTNIASGEALHTQVVVQHGAIPHLIKLMLSNNRDVAEQAVWALGNIVVDSTHYRDIILSQGGLTNLRQLQNRCFGVLNETAIQNVCTFEQLLEDECCQAEIALLRMMAWALSNFFVGSPQTDIKYAQSGIEALTFMLTIPDSEILENAGRGFSYLTYRDADDNINGDNIKNDIINNNKKREQGAGNGDADEHVEREGEVSNEKKELERQREGEVEGDGKKEREKDGNIRSYNDKIEFMKKTGALLRLIQCLGYDKKIKGVFRVQIAALRALGRIASGDDKVTQYLVDLGICDSLLPLLDLREYRNDNKYDNKLLKDTCWVISNITAGTHEQMDRVIRANLFPSLINVLDKVPFNVRKEALWALCNATCGASKNQIRYLVDCGVIHSMMNLLECNDSEILLTVMKGLNHILECGEDVKNAENSSIEENEFKCYVESGHGLDKVRCIQYCLSPI